MHPKNPRTWMARLARLALSARAATLYTAIAALLAGLAMLHAVPAAAQAEASPANATTSATTSAVTSTSTSAVTSTSTDPAPGRSPQLAAAQGQFQQAAAGQTAAIAPALVAWQALLAAEAGNLTARAHVGALTAMQANTTLLPWRKMGFADDGLALLDKALAQLTPAHDQQLFNSVPVSLQVRLVAAGTFGALPAMFNRGERASRLLDSLVKSPLLGSTPPGFQAAVWLQAGKLAARNQRSDEARQWFNRVMASGAPQAAEAQALLKGL